MKKNLPMTRPDSGCWLFTLKVALGLLLAPLTVASAQVKLPTVDEAQALSMKTGRPIFAMAGRET